MRRNRNFSLNNLATILLLGRRDNAFFNFRDIADETISENKTDYQLSRHFRCEHDENMFFAINDNFKGRLDEKVAGLWQKSVF
ncbi:hypothetical protein ES703_95207 [subsurface metagenome]